MKQINILTLCGHITVKGNLKPQVIKMNDSEFSGCITLDATEESVKDSLDAAMLQLQSLTERYQRDKGLGDDTYYDYVPDFMDQIAQLVYHALDLHVSFEVQEYVDTTVALWELIYKEDDEIWSPFCEGNIEYIQNLVKESNNLKIL